jgi:Asp-tRNA(Asn)/Glu-tRNA(Gln) amidotransferase A subunit family amidase
MTASARDAALVLQVLAGHDRSDAMSRDVPVPDYTGGWDQSVRGLRLALCPDFYTDAEIDSEVGRCFENAVQVFRSLGAQVDQVSFPKARRLTELFPAIAGPEFVEFHRPLFEKNPDGYGTSVRERLDWSFKITSDEYVRALRERTLLRRRVAEFFEHTDALLLPAMPCAAALIATLLANVNDKQQPCMWIHRPFESPHNLTGCPAIAVPKGYDREGLPLSLQIVTPEWHEARLLAIANAYEQATPELRARRPRC